MASMFSHPGFSTGSSRVISFRLKRMGSSVKSVGRCVARHRRIRNSNYEFSVAYFLGSMWPRLLLPLEYSATATKRGLGAQVPGLEVCERPLISCGICSDCLSHGTVSARKPGRGGQPGPTSWTRPQLSEQVLRKWAAL